MRCSAVAAPEAPAAAVQGPIVMNGQVLHSITEERLALVRSIGGYVEDQVRLFAATLLHSCRSRCASSSSSNNSRCAPALCSTWLSMYACMHSLQPQMRMLPRRSRHVGLTH